MWLKISTDCVVVWFELDIINDTMNVVDDKRYRALSALIILVSRKGTLFTVLRDRMNNSALARAHASGNGF